MSVGKVDRFFALLVAAVLVTPIRTMAATLFWDGSGTGWNAAASWSTASDAALPDPSSPPGSGDLASFSISSVSLAQTVNLNAAASASGLTFNSPGATTVQSGSGTNMLTIGSNGITVNSGTGPATLTSAISTPSSQTWANNSTNTLTASGDLTLGFATLTVDGTGDTMVAKIIGVPPGSSTPGALVKTGTGTLSSSAANTYGQGTSILGGILSIATMNSLGTPASILVDTMIDGGTLKYTGAATSTNRFFKIGSSGATFDASGSGALTFSNSSEFFGPSGAWSLTLTGSSTADNTFAATLRDTINFSKTGPSTWVLSGLNYNWTAGTIDISGGVLKALNSFSFGGTSIPIGVHGGTLDLAGTVISAHPVSISGSGVGGAGAIVNNGQQQLGSNGLNIQSLTLTGDAAIGGSGGWGIGAGSLNPNNLVELAGHMLAKTGANEIALYSSTINNSGAAPATIEVRSGVLWLDGAVFTGAAGGSIVYQSGTKALIDTQQTAVAWPITLIGGNIMGAAGSGAVGNVLLLGDVTFEPMDVSGNLAPTTSHSFTVSGSITEDSPHSITKLGVNTLTLSGNNSFTGGILIKSGTLRSSSAGALSTTGTITLGDTSGSGTATLNFAGSGHTSLNVTGINVISGSTRARASRLPPLQTMSRMRRST